LLLTFRVVGGVDGTRTGTRRMGCFPKREDVPEQEILAGFRDRMTVEDRRRLPGLPTW